MSNSSYIYKYINIYINQGFIIIAKNDTKIRQNIYTAKLTIMNVVRRRMQEPLRVKPQTILQVRHNFGSTVYDNRS